MSENKFTKGEWHCSLGNTYACVRIKGKVIADLRTVNAIYNKHDAHLIAAAPDMHEFIESLQLSVADDIRRNELLAKARGE